MTEKQLIGKLQMLKQIKPREDWVLLVKSQILKDSLSETKNIVAKSDIQAGTITNNNLKLNYKELLANVFHIIFNKKLAYVFPLFFFVCVGVFSFFMIQNAPNQASLVQSVQNSQDVLVAVKDNIEDLKVKSQKLEQVAKNEPEKIQSAIDEIKSSAKSLTDTIQKNPKLAREFAKELKELEVNGTLASLSAETDLQETSDALYKTIVEQMMEDLNQTTLTQEQQESLNEIKNLYDNGNYSGALGVILLLNIRTNDLDTNVGSDVNPSIELKEENENQDLLLNNENVSLTSEKDLTESVDKSN